MSVMTRPAVPAPETGARDAGSGAGTGTDAGGGTGASTGAWVQLVVCRLADERYGLRVDRVHEIIRQPTITALPQAGGAVRGVINLRGRIVPVVDLRERFGLPRVDTTKLSRVVVVDAADVRVGIIVDAVTEVIHVDGDAIEPRPVIATGPGADHVTGIGRTDDGLIILLDLDRLLAPDAAAAASAGATASTS